MGFPPISMGSVHIGFSGQAVIRDPACALQEVAEHMGAPPVAAEQVEAVALVQEIAAEPKLRFDVLLRPGLLRVLPPANPEAHCQRSEFSDGECVCNDVLGGILRMARAQQSRAQQQTGLV